jgi:hypothetical protein
VKPSKGGLGRWLTGPLLRFERFQSGGVRACLQHSGSDVGGASTPSQSCGERKWRRETSECHPADLYRGLETGGRDEGIQAFLRDELDEDNGIWIKILDHETQWILRQIWQYGISSYISYMSTISLYTKSADVWSPSRSRLFESTSGVRDPFGSRSQSRSVVESSDNADSVPQSMDLILAIAPSRVIARRHFRHPEIDDRSICKMHEQDPDDGAGRKFWYFLACHVATAT